MKDKQYEEDIASLKKVLHNQITDEHEITKMVYQVLKDSLKNRQYELEIDNYHFNLIPANLSIKYEDLNCLLIINRNDFYYETERQTDIRYFILPHEKKDKYYLDTPALRTSGSVINIAGHSRENYLVELISNNPNDKIINYIRNREGIKILDDLSALISREITINTPVINLLDYFNPNIIPVYYSYIEECYDVDTSRINNLKTYQLLLPDLTERKELIKKLYRIIIEFYSQFLNK